MQLFLIKIGKAWSVLQRDGIVAGGRRILTALGSFAERVPEGDILLVSGGVGDSARYRTKNVAEELNNNGFRASYTVQDSPFFAKTVNGFKVIVFHRVVQTPAMAEYVAKAKALGRTIIFETDDLVYDPKYFHLMDYYTKMNSLERRLYQNGVGAELLADPYVTHATTSTLFLKKKLESKGKTVFLVQNKMSAEDVVWAQEILDRKKDKKEGEADSLIRISYLSGVPSHNKDFATITVPLQKILAEFPHVRLVLAGPLDTSDSLNVFESQITRVPFAPRRKYFDTVASADINLAPLEIGNDFCEAKSELKFFEAGLLAVPTVASATGTFQGAITDGVDGYVAAGDDEWYEKLKTLIMDSKLRSAIGNKARAIALERYTTQNGKSEEYYQFLRSVLQ